MIETLTIPGARVLPSNIGPVMPVVDIADMLGYSRSAITKAIKDHEGKMSPCKTFLPLPTPGGNQQFLCLNRTGVDYLLLFIHPSKTRMGDDEYIDFRHNLLERMGGGGREIVQVQQGPVLETELTQAKRIAELTGTDLKTMQAAALRKCGLKEYADALTPALIHGEAGSWLNPTQIGNRCGHSAREVNNFLEWHRFQYRGPDGLWRLTDKGELHGEEYDYPTVNRHIEKRIRWKESILYASGLIREPCETLAKV